MVMELTIQKTLDLTKDLFAAAEDLMTANVLVGIPERTARQGQKENTDINNAQKLFLNTQGTRALEMRREMDANMTNDRRYREAYQMYIQAHGSPLWHTPPRPVIEPAIEANKEEIAELLEEAASERMQGNKREWLNNLRKAGMMGQNVSRGWFTDRRNGWAENAPATIKAKGSNRPLIDTGAMRRAITYVVDTGKGEY